MKNYSINRIWPSFLLAGVLLYLFGCKAKGNDPGVEYAPEMYYSQAYEPLKQITDSTYFDYNSNPYNKYRINMREPAPNTIRRGADLPYHIPADSLDIAARVLKNPIATRVKLNDLTDNMDIRRLNQLEDAEVQRIRKYFNAYKWLLANI